MGKSSSRFSFILKNGNNELDETISLLFSNIAQSQYKGDLAKLIRDNITSLWGSGWCVVIGKSLDKAIRYYKGYCCIVYDSLRDEEILIFRPSSMPITEKIGDNEDIDKKDWTMDMKIHLNTMDPTLFAFVKRSIAYAYSTQDTVSSFDIRKYVTIGCGPLFHVIASQNSFKWSLDDQADQIVSLTVNGTNYLIWRMLLKTHVFSEKKNSGVIDNKWVLILPVLVGIALIVLIVVKNNTCNEIDAKNLDNGFFDDELLECYQERRNFIYAAVVAFVIAIILGRTQKKRRMARIKMA
ncbi:hypothetical protein WA171_006337, partial [Blastocystis sp. BT1]